MVAIATKGAERYAQLANFFNAIRQRVTRAGDEIAGYYRGVRSKFVGHFHGAPYLRRRHVAAKMNVTDLHDGQAIQRRIQVGDENFLAVHLILKTLSRVTVHRTEEWRCSRSCSSGAEKITPPRIAELFHTRGARETNVSLHCRSGRVRMRLLANSGPQKTQAAHKFYRHEAKNCAEKPQANQRRNDCSPRYEVMVIHANAIYKGADNQKYHGEPQQACRYAQPLAAKIGRGAPDGPVPKAL